MGAPWEDFKEGPKVASNDDAPWNDFKESAPNPSDDRPHSLAQWAAALMKPREDVVEPSTAAQFMAVPAIAAKVPAIAKAAGTALSWGAASAGMHGAGAIARKLGLK